MSCGTPRRSIIKIDNSSGIDEPTNHFDQKSVTALTGYLQATDKTVAVITHDDSLQAAMEKQLQV